MALIEIVVSAALLALVLLGVLGGVDGPGRVSAQSQLRSTAAALASQDQDRMHAMRAVDLSNYTASRPLNVSGVTYTVASRADWVNDSNGTVSCSTNSTSANYLQLTSTVSWPRIPNGKPVALTSLLAPPAGAFSGPNGNLSVQLQDQAGAAVIGIPIGISGTASGTQPTNAAGCAYFGYIASGSYSVALNQPGYVDSAEQTSVTIPATVTAGQTTAITRQYALAGQLTASFDTKVGSSFQPAQAQAVTLVNTGILPSGTVTFAPGGAQSQIVAAPLFPFPSGYAAYAGACSSNNPVAYVTDYFSSNPGQVNLLPGGAAGVTLHTPAINIHVTKGGLPLENANVRVTAVGSGCNEVFPPVRTNAQGALTQPGYPFGPYTVCVDDGQRQVLITGVLNTDVAGTATLEFPIPTVLGVLGTCP